MGLSGERVSDAEKEAIGEISGVIFEQRLLDFFGLHVVLCGLKTSRMGTSWS